MTPRTFRDLLAEPTGGEFFELRLRVGPHEFAATSPHPPPEGAELGVTFLAPLFFSLPLSA